MHNLICQIICQNLFIVFREKLKYYIFKGISANDAANDRCSKFAVPIEELV